MGGQCGCYNYTVRASGHLTNVSWGGGGVQETKKLDKQFFFNEQMNYLVTVSTSLC